MPNHPRGSLARIEANSHRTVTIETEWSSSIAAKCHPQEQSPIFQIPKELRDEVFRYATAPYESLDRCDNSDLLVCCAEHGIISPPPMRTFEPKTGSLRKASVTAILATCRRAWLEANGLPLRQAVPSFWLHEGGRRGQEVAYDTQSQQGVISRTNTIRPLNKAIADIFFKIHPKAHDEQPGRPPKPPFCRGYLEFPSLRGEWLRENPDLELDFTWILTMLQCPAMQDLLELRVELEAIDAADEPLLEFFRRRIRQAFQPIQTVRCLGCRWNIDLHESDLGKLVKPPDRKPCKRTVNCVAAMVWTVVEAKEARTNSDHHKCRPNLEELFTIGSTGSEAEYEGYDQERVESLQLEELLESENQVPHLECTQDCHLYREMYLEKWARQNSLLKFEPVS
ncbi:uncharacterized protein LTR77_002675 [Saxophila tyrrhenica]|uniref:Uncharacterized protein n=1 Tax=Saxophila tyrrhenica TaxID=1690608 RepID=A0AAV9PG54_9PEZI|nr:hypothetical protein LTR77_002675 [Saxophila tyrrhenica]